MRALTPEDPEDSYEEDDDEYVKRTGLKLGSDDDEDVKHLDDLIEDLKREREALDDEVSRVARGEAPEEEQGPVDPWPDEEEFLKQMRAHTPEDPEDSYEEDDDEYVKRTGLKLGSDDDEDVKHLDDLIEDLKRDREALDDEVSRVARGEDPEGEDDEDVRHIDDLIQELKRETEALTEEVGRVARGETPQDEQRPNQEDGEQQGVPRPEEHRGEPWPDEEELLKQMRAHTPEDPEDNYEETDEEYVKRTGLKHRSGEDEDVMAFDKLIQDFKRDTQAMIDNVDRVARGEAPEDDFEEADAREKEDSLVQTAAQPPKVEAEEEDLEERERRKQKRREIRKKKSEAMMAAFAALLAAKDKESWPDEEELLKQMRLHTPEDPEDSYEEDVVASTNTEGSTRRSDDDEEDEDVRHIDGLMRDLVRYKEALTDEVGRVARGGAPEGSRSSSDDDEAVRRVDDLIRELKQEREALIDEIERVARGGAPEEAIRSTLSRGSAASAA